MKKWYRVLVISLILTILLALPALALNRTRREVGVTYNNDAGNQRSQITLTWTYQNGDTLYRTWDGRTWTQITFTPPVVGQQVSVVSDVYVPYYANIYFEIRTGSYAPANRTDPSPVDPQFITIPVYPPLRNAHSEFSTNTDLCAGCHVTHAAEGPKLIKAANNLELCRTCHGPGSPGSRYGVWDGTIRLKDGTYVKSNGGPVVGGPGTPWGAVTSTHIGGNNTPTPGGPTLELWTPEFTCTDCHFPHASMNGYRLLNGRNGVPVWAWAYNSTGLVKESVYYENFGNTYCYACHSKYDKGPDSGHTVEYDVYGYQEAAAYVYRHTSHTTDITTWNGGLTTTLPLDNDKKIFCLTCHYPHGTDVTGYQVSNFDKNRDGSINQLDESTMLKRKNNSGICQDCHKK